MTPVQLKMSGGWVDGRIQFLHQPGRLTIILVRYLKGGQSRSKVLGEIGVYTESEQE